MPSDTRTLAQWLHYPATRRIVLAISLTLTVAGVWLARKATEERNHNRFLGYAEDIRVAVEKRMSQYEALLRSGDGLFDAYGTVKREHWRAFVASLDIERHFPGIRGLGFSLMIPQATLGSHIGKIRAEGFPAYTVRPPGERELYSSIIYLEPFDWRNQRAFGYDMFSEPVRREAMERARDTGQPALSGRVILVQETEQDVQYGVLMYMPVYRGQDHEHTEEQRRADLVGFVYAPFRMGDLMAGILGTLATDLDFELYDGNRAQADRLLYTTGAHPLPNAGADRLLVSQKALVIGGRPWTLMISARSGYVPTVERALPWVALIGGIGFNLLLFLLLNALYRGRLQAEAMAQELSVANRELEDFAHIASHDLKEPLRGLHNYAGFMQEDYADRLDDTGRQYLVRMQRLAERMSLLIDKLLAWSRAGTGQLLRESVALDAVIDEVLRDLGSLLTEQRARVIRPGSLPTVACDPSQIGEVFQNLIVNAVRYNDSADKRIEIGFIPGPPAPTFYVRDNGIGIAPQHLDSIFRLFKRLHEQERYGEGSGAGLTIVKRIIERHGGRIWVESTPGRGSTFLFTLQAESQ